MMRKQQKQQLLCRACLKQIEKLKSQNFRNELEEIIAEKKVVRFMKEICPGELRRNCEYYIDLTH